MKHMIIFTLTSTLILFFSGCTGESTKTDAKTETAKKCGDGKCGEGKCGDGGKCGDASKPVKNTP